MEYKSIMITTLEPKPSKIYTGILDDNTTLGIMDWVIRYSYTRLGNGEAVVYSWWDVGGSIGIIVQWVEWLSPKMGKGSANYIPDGIKETRLRDSCPCRS